MPQNTIGNYVSSPRAASCRWLWLVTAIAIAGVVVAFRRYASNERIAYAVAVGASRRRAESTAATSASTSS